MSIIYKLLYTMGILSKYYYLHSRLARLDKMLYGLVLGEIFFIIFYYVIIRVKNKGDKSKIISSFNLNKLTLKQIGFYIAFAMITSGMYYSANKFLGNIFPDAVKSDKQFINGIKNSFSFVVLKLSAIITTPIHEEMLFRNLVPRKLAKTFSPLWIIIMQGLFFGFAHMNSVKFISASLYGIVMFIIVLWSGSLYAGIITHFIGNSQIFIQPFIKTTLIKVFSCSDILAGQILDKFYLLVGILFIPMLWIAYKNRKYNALDKEHPYYD